MAGPSQVPGTRVGQAYIAPHQSARGCSICDCIITILAGICLFNCCKALIKGDNQVELRKWGWVTVIAGIGALLASIFADYLFLLILAVALLVIGAYMIHKGRTIAQRQIQAFQAMLQADYAQPMPPPPTAPQASTPSSGFTAFTGKGHTLGS